MPGIYLINKPKGITSHDVVGYLRKVTGEKTIGHAGTLDPLASGLMIVAIGREFTKRISEFSKLDKEYLAEATLGATSTTYDAEGEIKKFSFCHSERIRQLAEKSKNLETQVPRSLDCARDDRMDGRDDRMDGRNDKIVELNQAEIESALQSFIGPQEQMPPIFSAKKIKGQKAYDLARQGKTVELKAVPVTISEIKLLDYQYPILKFKVKVSSGTYIRSLVHDLGQRLNKGAYMSELVRTSIGDYNLTQAIDLYQVKSPADLHPHQLPLGKGEGRGGYN
ncbi:MAG: tRNA pseudouridine(55) synthase TruB [Patescibacteria group bacterium]|jgi:tRNA pseudouridine55 synthase